MDSLPGTYLLEYARFHGIAIDHQAVDPIDLTTPLLEVEGVNHDLSDPKEAPILDFSASRNAIENNLRKEKLQVGKDAAIFLSSVLAEIASGGGVITDAEWDASLTKHRCINDLKLESPLLTAECVSEMANFGKRTSLDTILSDLLPLEEEQTENDEGLSFPEYFWELPDEIWAEVKSEKLDCSKDTLRLLHEVRLPDEKTLAMETTESFNRTLDLRENCPRRPISPLYLEPETQFTTSARSSPAASLSPTSNAELPCTKLEQTEVEGQSTGTIESLGSLSNFEEHNYTRNRDTSLEKLDEFFSVLSANQGRSQPKCQDKRRKTSSLNTPSLSIETVRETNHETRTSGHSERHSEVDVNTSPEIVSSTAAELQVDNNPSDLVSVATQAVEASSKKAP